MPANRNTPSRRSVRLSRQGPRSYSGSSICYPFLVVSRLIISGLCVDDQDLEALELTYPNSEPETSATSVALSNAVSTMSLSGQETELSSLLPPFVPSASHARRRKAGHVPRPPNAFMIFRSDMWRMRKFDRYEKDHRNVSVIAGILWRDLSPEKQQYYQLRATIEKQRHALQNPGYKYSPVVRKQKSTTKKTRNESSATMARCQKLASIWLKDVEESAHDVPVKINDGAWSSTLSLSGSSDSSASTPRPLSHSASSKSESPAELAPSSEPSTSEEFVPTDDIPPLDLNAPSNVTDVCDMEKANILSLTFYPTEETRISL
jgi:HMG (high mobility group) box